MYAFFLRKHATLGMQVSVLREPMACSRRTVGPNIKNPPKIQSKKIVKLTDHTYACNSLTNFYYEAYVIIGNGDHVNLLKFVWK